MPTALPVRIVLRCDQDGRDVRADADCGGWLAARSSGDPLPRRVDAGSAAKCERFLERVRAAGGAFGWELVVPTPAGGVSVLLFAGLAQSDGRLLIVAAATHQRLLALLDESTAQGAASALSASAPSDGFLAAHPPLDELTRVNNDLVNLQRELAKRNAELTAITQQRNALLAAAAHDLRNPVLVVQGYCDLLGGMNAGTRQHELLEQVQRASELMLHVIEDTLEYTRFESGNAPPKLASVDLWQLVERSVESYRPMAERKHVQLTVRCGDRLPPLRLDAINIERVLGNLLSNAIKFSDQGGCVEVSLARRGGDALLTVSDGGPGIAESEVPLLFRPFQTASARPTGGEPSTGLGLAIVRALVEANGGEISVRSVLHQGSTFEVRFPLPEEGRGRLPGPAGGRGREPAVNVPPDRNRSRH